MNITIKNDKIKQWVWFAAIWIASLLAALTLGYTIKFFMSLI